MENGEHFFIILSKVLSENSLVNAFSLDDVGCDGIWSVLMDEAFGDVVCDGLFWFFVEHEDEEFGFLGEFFVFSDVAQFGHKFTIPIFIFFGNAFWYMMNIQFVLFQVDF